MRLRSHQGTHRTSPALHPTLHPTPAGVVYPKEGPTNKQTGRRVDKLGPLESFLLDFSDKKGVQVGRVFGGTLACDPPQGRQHVARNLGAAMVTPALTRLLAHRRRAHPCCHQHQQETSTCRSALADRHLLVACPPSTCQVIAATKEGQYLLTKPAASYKKVYTPLAEKAAIAFEVRRLKPLRSLQTGARLCAPLPRASHASPACHAHRCQHFACAQVACSDLRAGCPLLMSFLPADLACLPRTP